MLSRLASDIYYSLVKGPVWAYLTSKGALQELEKVFLDNKPNNYVERPTYAAEFEKYVFNRKDVRNLVKEYVNDNVLPKAGDLISRYSVLIEGDHLKDPTQTSSQLEI